MNLMVEEKRSLYSQLFQKGGICESCPLFHNPMVLFDSNCGNPFNENIDLLIVAEAPGREEVEKGVPLIGRSGQIVRKCLDKYITNKNIKWFITNTCLCRPDNNKTPSMKAVKCCKINLDSVIELTKPKIILALGRTALKGLCINDVKLKDIKYIVFRKYKDFNVVVLPHPAAILRHVVSEDIYDKVFSKLSEILK